MTSNHGAQLYLCPVVRAGNRKSDDAKIKQSSGELILPRYSKVIFWHPPNKIRFLPSGQILQGYRVNLVHQEDPEE